MTGQVQGNIVARSTCTNDNYLFSGVFLRGRVLEGVYEFPLEFFLGAVENQFRGDVTWKTRRKDLFREFGNIPRSSSPSQSKNKVGWTENTRSFLPAREHPGQVDNPCS